MKIGLELSGAIMLGMLAGCGASGQANVSPPERPGFVAVKRAAVTDPGACGIREPYVVTKVGGVALSRPAILTMKAARALDLWVRRSAIPAVGNRGGGLAELTVAAHYACRTRNGRKGAKLSEHAKGRAIDISSFVMRDGSRITVLDGWNKPGDRKILRNLHRLACGPFGTVLGPNADANHRDHFHFDVASYRSGTYCR